MITKHYFGTMDDGRDVYTYLLKNDAGMSVRICEFGGANVEISVPDRLGRMTDVVAGYDSLRDYVLAPGYLGALVGRVCNRIAKGKFRLGTKEYQIYKNNNGNSLHGGKIGFSHKLWDVKAEDGEEPRLVLNLISPDGDENYPGTLNVTVTYTLMRSNALAIHYEATTDQTTIVNLTNHAYFNLGGFSSGKIFDHVLQMDADKYIPTDENLIPTGEIRSVAGTPFDFREPKTIGEDFDLENPDMKLAGGFDHCICFTGGETKTPVLRIEAYEPNSGRLMQVYTNQPAVQFYTGNFMWEIESPLKGGCPASVQAAFCLETQKMPDAINHSNFDDVVLKPGEKYDYTTIYQFSTK
jgi:aldose 1-epimerase